MTPQRSQAVTDSSHTVAVAIAAALGAVWQGYIGLINAVLVLTVGLWFLDMLGGTLRAMIVAARAERAAWAEGVRLGTETRPRACPGRAALKAPTWIKGGEGLLKLVCVFLWVGVGGALEIAGMTMGIPAVGPGLFVAMVLLSTSIVDQVLYFWPHFGVGVQSIIERVAQTTGQSAPPQED